MKRKTFHRLERVRTYLKKYDGDFYKVASTGDVIYIGDNLPSEYSGLKYTHGIVMIQDLQFRYIEMMKRWRGITFFMLR